MCWAFDVRPSQLDVVYWSNSHQDIKTQLKLRLGFEQSKVYQEYQTIAKVVIMAFGGGKKKDATPRTFEEAEAAFRSVFDG